MLRDKNLIPLSHQHQHALALCVRIDRASPIAESDLPAWQVEIAQIVQGEIQIHFAAEEEVLFPAASEFTELRPLVEELLADHAWLRVQFTQASAQSATPKDIQALAQRLATHIRKEERRLFERIQQLMNAGELAILGRKLDEAMKQPEQACVLPTEATRLRPAK